MNMKIKIKKHFSDIRNDIDNKLRRVCLRLSPMKRFAIVLSLCIVFGAVNIYMLVSSICEIEKQDTQKEFLETEHIKPFELQHSNHLNDSIKQLKNQMYEQQIND
jgi:hypothetical protein